MPDPNTGRPPLNRPGILTGAVAGLMLTASLIAVFYLAWRLAGLPFVAFDVFDWMARKLPGSVVTFGIDAIVNVIRALNLGATAETAKTAEKAMAIAGLLVAGAIAAALLFALLRAFRGKYAYLFGAVTGAAAGLPVILISRNLSQTSTASPILAACLASWRFSDLGRGSGLELSASERGGHGGGPKSRSPSIPDPAGRRNRRHHRGRRTCRQPRRRQAQA